VTRALVVGSSAEVWQEVEAAQALCRFDAFYIIKMTGIHWDQGFFYWITLHPEYMGGYKAKRRELGLPDDYQIVSPPPTEVGRHGDAANAADRRVSYRWPGMTSSGSSGLFGVKVALDDGHDRVVCAGIPMLRDAGHFARGKPWTQVDSFTRGWEIAMPHLKDKVRSMSGWTKEKLGVPTSEWLAEGARSDLPSGRDAHEPVMEG
jgi:hypothetical protein